MTQIPRQHLASQSVSYHPTQRAIEAYDWHGKPVRFETPGELFHALNQHHVYARHAVITAGIWLCIDHGVDVQLLPLDEVPLFVIELTERMPLTPQRMPLLNQTLQRIDRGNEKCARLACALLTDEDHLTIIDTDGLFAATIHRILIRESEHPSVHVHINTTGEIPAPTTIALICGSITDDGAVIDDTTAALLHQLQERTLPRYVVAPHGPRPLSSNHVDTSISAVVTARGIYRPDRVQRFYRDSDMGSDIISLS